MELPSADDRVERDAVRNTVDGLVQGSVVQANHVAGSIYVGNDESRSAAYLGEPDNWPLTAEWDPIQAGVLRSRPGADDRGIPPYVRRDIDEQLRSRMTAACDHGGLVYLVGCSASGKTRTAFEAMLATMPDYRVAAPVTGADLPAVLETILQRQIHCVLWLDDLERFFGPGELDATMLAAFVRLRVPIVGTIRTPQYDLLNPGSRSSLDTAVDSSPGPRAGIGARVLAMVEPILLPRLWTQNEVDGAVGEVDERIADAVEHHRSYGIPEYLVAGPSIWSEWRRAFEIGGLPRGAALVSAAVELERAGLPGTYSQSLLVDLHEAYLEEQGGSLLRAESLPDAFMWAAEERFGITSPLLPIEDGRWLVFQYLVDRTEQSSPRSPVKDLVWQRAVEHAANDHDAMGVAVRAATAATVVSLQVAEQIWLSKTRHPAVEIATIAAYNLGVLLLETDRPTEARAMFLQSAEGGEPRAAFNLSILLDEAGEKVEALEWCRTAAEAGYTQACFRLGFELESQGEIEEAEAWYRRGAELGEYRCATNLGNIMSASGRRDEAQTWYSRANELGDSYATFNIGLFHHDSGRLDLATQWYTRASEQGSAEAALNLGVMRSMGGDLLEAEKWYRLAADRGLAGAAFTWGTCSAAWGGTETLKSGIEGQQRVATSSPCAF
ncbi:tetratricopeptide repeat protein [Nocardia crassostreae]|uniref:tetratricopeptide repeat protein n=1 Tax=Nocardia crassostreae TaxID=53428 RepID=UPI000A74E130|nr:tetratricopeptide repeat protein [Nocardia crassostreae]